MKPPRWQLKKKKKQLQRSVGCQNGSDGNIRREMKQTETGTEEMKVFFLSHLVLYITFWRYVFFGGAPRALCSITGNTTAHRATAKQYPAYISSRRHLTDIKKLPGTEWRRSAEREGRGRWKCT